MSVAVVGRPKTDVRRRVRVSVCVCVCRVYPNRLFLSFRDRVTFCERTRARLVVINVPDDDAVLVVHSCIRKEKQISCCVIRYVHTYTCYRRMSVNIYVFNVVWKLLKYRFIRLGRFRDLWFCKQNKSGRRRGKKKNVSVLSTRYNNM